MKNLCILICFACTSVQQLSAQRRTAAQRADSVIRLMTLEEKIGQLNQYNGDWSHTGPITPDGDKQRQLRNGRLGSMLNVMGVAHTRAIQDMAMQSRLKIPILFGQDVIHGFYTTFPIPLAQAASWDMEAIEQAERIAATEASASGIHWSFSPMVDIARDPRWGRVMEGAGEDTYLGARIAAARVRGFQGKGIGSIDAVMACVKHFAAYGAAIGGRDYNSVDMSLHALWQYYLPPFKAAIDAGVGSVMNAFNSLNGIPATGNKYLIRTILKDKWHFKGLVVSDWGSVGGLARHGFAADNKDAAKKAMEAGCDMDMESRCYKDHLAQLVKEGSISIGLVNDAVQRILIKKFELGLFDDPYRFCDSIREKQQMHNPEHAMAARLLAEKSIVLLQNDNAVLPISKQTKTIAFIGPFVRSVRDNLGFWSMEWPDDSATIVTQWEGIKAQLDPSSRLLYSKGCNINDIDTSGFAEARVVAAQADVVIMSMGEARDMSGEAKSRSNIHLPGMQEALISAVASAGRPVVLLINAGRPLVFNAVSGKVQSIVYTWWLGSQAGNAIADVLFGNYNPSGKLAMSFPRTEGQIPIYYNHLNTGHAPPNDSAFNYVSGFIDLKNSPQYPFGFGLSYTTFSYGDIMLDKKAISTNQQLQASVEITNTGRYDGTETVQLYIRDLVASVARPVKELAGFQKIFLKKGETKKVMFTLTEADLRFYNDALEYVSEPGEFKLFIGSDSDAVKEASFTLKR